MRICPFCGEMFVTGHVFVSHLSPLARTIRDHLPGVDISNPFSLCRVCVEGVYAVHTARMYWNERQKHRP